MARPSLAKQRREEILDALELCILDKGIQASSLEYIAETANMKRTILRHYIGNRDEIICALSQRWTEKFASEWQLLLDWLPKDNRLEALIDTLFSSRSKDYINRAVIAEALFSEAKRLPDIKQDQQKTMKLSVQFITDVISKQHPTADKEKVRLVACGVHANYVMSESLLPISLTDEIYSLKQSCLLLISTLK